MAFSIPPFDVHGVIPPVRPGEAGHSTERAPYPTDALTLCQRFGATPERRTILVGLFSLRGVLRQLGFTAGFQWIDGSFVEDVERTRERPPGDIDVVTFAALGDEEAQMRLGDEHPELFDAKERFLVDHYLVPTDLPLDRDLAHYIAYWYSMWAHRRDDLRWKGFVALTLAEDDGPALRWLAQQAEKAAAAEEIES